MNLYPNRRHQKAMNLTAHVMHVIEKHLRADTRFGDVARELNDLFYAAGVDVITEADRIKAGLAPRNHNGLTLEEIAILDARFKLAMMEPLNEHQIVFNKENN